ncbi:MAG: NUDIX hydrolase [Bacilli bacterium]|nr:NUDIX hydrolase [Bacilli bacterium]
MKFYEVDGIVDLDKYNYSNYKVGVIVHIKDSNDNILLQQRGLKSRDENGLYEDVGGKVDKDDADFRSAIEREIKEEMGEDVVIELSNPIGVWYVPKKDTNWLFVVFKGTYLSGNIKIMEPDKCMGYKFFTYEEAIQSNMLSESCSFLVKTMKKNGK